MTVTLICTKHKKPFSECGCLTITAMPNTTHVMPDMVYRVGPTEPISEVQKRLTEIKVQEEQAHLNAIRAIVREEIAKALAEQEDGTPHIVQVRQSFEAGGTCEYVDWDGKRYKGVLFPVDEKEN